VTRAAEDTRGADEARARVERVVAMGRRVSAPEDPLGIEARRRLRGGGLHPEGVELALTEHLETRPSGADLSALVGGTGRAPRCHVVLSANVCTASLRAIALATATARATLVRPSRRDPVLAEILTAALAADPVFADHGGSIALISEIDPADGDEVHVYGHDSTIAAFREALGPGVVLRGHGTGFGAAIVGLGIDLPAAAHALARDVVPFDQGGCLSPRVVLVEGGVGRSLAFRDALDGALAELGRRVPRGDLDAAARGEITLYRAAAEAIGELTEGPHHTIGLDLDPRSLALPPAARVVHVARAASAEVASRLLDPWRAELTAIGADDDGAVTSAAWSLAPRARRSRLGWMQRPPLDGPVDRRAER
jgi:hypothetical protein